MNKALVSEIKPEILYAGFWKRVAAHVVDNLILTLFNLIVIGLGLGFVLGIIINMLGFTLGAAANMKIFENIMVIISLFAILLYYAFFESSSKKATLGKQAMKIVVVNQDYKQLTFVRAAGRAFIMLIPNGLISISGFDTWARTIGFGLWFSMVLAVTWTKKKQGLHDILAECLVVNQEAIAQLPKATNEAEQLLQSIVDSAGMNEELNADKQEA